MSASGQDWVDLVVALIQSQLPEDEAPVIARAIAGFDNSAKGRPGPKKTPLAAILFTSAEDAEAYGPVQGRGTT
jgi:hypothetical protein